MTRMEQKRGVQLRLLHTSAPLLARKSFVSQIKDKLQKVDTNKVMGVGAAGYGLAKVAKFGAVAKYALPALKLTKAMPLMSMGLTTVCYSCLFGVPFAIGIVGTLFASNAARAATLKKFGCEVPMQMMVPLLGVMSSNAGTDYKKREEFVLMDKPFKRCLVILAPVAGMYTFTTAGPLMMGVFANSQCAWAVAHTGYFMTLISLVPLGDMTPGGQLLNYFSKNALLLGTGFNLCLLFVLSNPILYLCFFFNMYRLYKRGFVLFGRQIGGGDEAGDATLRGLTLSNFTDNQKAMVAAMYWGLFLLNAGGMFYVSKSLQSPQQIRQERRLLEPSTNSQYQQPGQPVPELQPLSSSWGVADWAMGNLEALQEMDRDEDTPDWWEQERQRAEREAAAQRQRSWT
eukprot:CAMPEP_0172681894 /NCGR_PEP_ID=MMETSP1074-20121228/17772_1 /TAXON_ID=2916 /ORGANISM="Ceratium fusus, Strain PA161109" /LENGTH=399 /DNA_ID=CAMNT_0013500471 /DNA_START=157 /DNA_END=1356 /DNA_ORIENTATION=-